MNPIVTKELKDVRYALGSYETAKNRYNQIKRTFPDGNEYRIFSEPIILSEGHKISWTTEYEGSVINFSKLTAEDQSITKDKLSDQMKKLFNAAKKFDDTTLVEFLYQCIEIPNLNDIYIIRKDNVDQIVLTQWGFVSDAPGAEKGILEKIINTVKVPMVFDVVYMDGSMATGIEVHFEYEGKKQIAKSDASGKITLEKVKIDSVVKAYELEKETPINIQTYNCYESGKYVIKVSQRLDMLFRVMNSKNAVLPNEEFVFQYNEEEIKLKTDGKGEMVLPKIRLETEVKGFQLKEGKEENINRFICEKDKKEYLIIIQVPEEKVVVPEPPKVYQMKFKVVDDENQIVPNAEITVSYNKKTAKLHTDEAGYAVLEGVEPGTQVKVIAKGEKQKKKK